MIKIVLGISTASMLTACSPEPKTFDDCILKYMPSTQERLAVTAIYDACENKFLN
ncbi:hypothetical protein ACG94X_16670 [Acinetobacter sp. ULE_I010]|jgi:hypothetical protein|uniref:hypothetical protein n=1 Tax=Acinetobacter sp. ULE_I010 TaxID=3373065 RepID=UPI003AF5016C